MKRVAAGLVFLVTLCGFAPGKVSAPDFMVGGNGASILVQAPSPEQAYLYLDRTLADMEFFRRNNYQVSLPAHPLFNGDSGQVADAAKGQATFINEVYRAEDFEKALGVLQGYAGPLKLALDRMAEWSAHEGFRVRDAYTVSLTLYGPGGSFDPDNGHITLWTDTEARFKGGGGLHTIIHEMVHIIIEHGIAQPFQLQHWERERVVDLIVQREFADLLPDYRLQGGGVAPIDSFVLAADLSGLREAVAQYVKTRENGGGR